MEESTSSKRENPDQIPQDDDTQGKTGRVVSEQAGVQGQRKEVNVESYSKVAAIGQILKDMDFPADKNKIISSQGNNNKVQEQIIKIEKMYYRRYKI